MDKINSVPHTGQNVWGIAYTETGVVYAILVEGRREEGVMNCS